MADLNLLIGDIGGIDARLAFADKAELTVVIVGPGTGLGTSGLRRQGDVHAAIPGEASHCRAQKLYPTLPSDALVKR